MTDRPTLYEGLRNRIKDGQTKAAERSAPDREAFAKKVKTDAALYGTPAWDALPASRKALVAEYTRQSQQGGTDDAA